MIFDPDLTPPCKHLTDKFFDPYHETETALLCNGCPIIDECRQYAYDNKIEFGVWGGTTAAHRKWEWRAWCSKGCGNKARQDKPTCTACGKPGRKPKRAKSELVEGCLAGA